MQVYTFSRAVPWEKSVCDNRATPFLGPVPIFKPAQQKDKCFVQCRAKNNGTENISMGK